MKTCIHLVSRWAGAFNLVATPWARRSHDAVPMDLIMPLEPADTTTSDEELIRTEGAYTSLGAPIPGGQVERWLVREGSQVESIVEMFDELCWRLVGDGLPLWRATLHMGTLHPMTRATGARWLREPKLIEEYRVVHGIEAADEYLRSPIRTTTERGTPFRRRLTGDIAEYPLLSKLRNFGVTDYFALALNRTYRRFPVVTWATDRPSGFTGPEIVALEEINPALAMIVEARAIRLVTDNLLDTYLGPLAGRRMLAGQIQRAKGERLRAVIMITDMRDFTALSDRLPGEEVIELLDDYFDAIVTSVEARKGETLKFLGDGVLSIFPAADDGDFSEVSVQALEAALEGLERLATVNKARRAADRTDVRTGIGLHLGEVIFGNVGAAHRLDFTVIGPAVNLASRIEGLTKQLLRPILVSRAFARVCPRPLVSLGFNPVRGLFEPEEVFGLPE
jgi:adenylate cyclase